MGIFNRLFKLGQAEVNSAIDKLEDPIKLTQQGIRDLKRDLDKSLKAYAEVKALAIRSKKEAIEQNSKAESYEQKAIMLLQKAQAGHISSDEADRLASEALVRKEECEVAAQKSEADAMKINNNLAQLDANIKKLKSHIQQYENELKILTARAKVSSATAKLNKQMAQIDSNGTISMLEKMKQKVADEEALSEAYGAMSEANKSLDDEISDVLGSAVNSNGSAALDALKARLKH